MSYPFAKAINWDEFIGQMNGIGVNFKTETILESKNNKISVTYFENKMDGETFVCVVDIIDRKQMLLPSTIRGILRNLHIHPDVCGLDLG
ncbi:MAG TPA: hypothetical protein VK840_05085 [Candidatus Dormibacteraeota bacterium]|nr:hypothetical protein [Candidatus Dormibacteraeota bacterium]